MKKVFIAAIVIHSMALSLTAQVPNYIPTNGLVGWWPFNGNANDESGNGNNGVVIGATLDDDRFGNPASAYNFNGTTNYIEVPHSSSLTFTASNQSISFWINLPLIPSPQGNDMGIFSKTNQNLAIDPTGNSNAGFEVTFGQYPSNNLYHRYKNGSSSPWGMTMLPNSHFAINQWCHVVCVINKNIDSAFAYFNGNLIDAKLLNSATSIGSNNLALLMGKGYWTSNGIPSNYFNGKLDDIGIWNRALTQQEITNLYTSSTPPLCNPLPPSLNTGLVGYWPFCGNANDESGNGNNGTVNGATLVADRFGNPNSAFSFDGINDFIELTHNPLFFNDTITISAWGEFNSTTALHITYSSATTGSYVCSLGSNVGHTNTNLGCSGYGGVGSFNPLNNNWHNATAVIAGNSTSLFVDGLLISTWSHSTITCNDTSHRLYFGVDIFGLPEFSYGIYDDIGIWNRALTQQEVVELYCGPNSYTIPYYSDSDNDGYGGLLLGNFCFAPPNGVIQSGDCDDTNPFINPGVPEICNGVDDDCDGIADDGLVPVLGNISGPAVQCIPLITGQAAFSLPAVPGATNYQWTCPQGMQILAGQGTQNLSVFWNLPSAHKGIVGPLSVTVTGTCGQATTSVDIHIQISIPVRPSSISGPLRVCPGDTATYSVLSVARARSYIWTLPTGLTLIEGESTNIIKTVVLNNYSGGVLSVSAANACGTGAVRTKNLLLNTPLSPLAISGQNSGLCKLEEVIYSVIQQPSTLAYNWTVPVGASIVSGQGSNSITVNYDSTFFTGAITVSGQNNCGSSPLRTLNVNAIPAKPGLINGATQICPGVTNQPYSVSTVVGADTYNWTVFNGVTVAGGQGTKNVLLNYPSISVTGKSINVIAGNSCGNSLPRYLSGINIDPVNCTRLSGGTNAESFEIYPNPANDVLYVNCKSQMPYQIEIYNLLGESVLRTVTTDRIDIRSLVEGVYILKGIVNDKVIVRRFEVAK
ncbi:MAG: LamG-like jellyroll fold domain-containing protein [Bacteroidia bacterium]